jgi:hypothetical protein
MVTSVNRRAVIAVAIALAVPAGLVAACSSNSDNPTPNIPVYPVDDAGDATTILPTDSGGSSAEASTSPDSSTNPGHDAGADAAPPCTSALTDAGCYVCPSTSPQFLNQCSGVGVQCSGFNNLTRLPNYDGGALAPLN